MSETRPEETRPSPGPTPGNLRKRRRAPAGRVWAETLGCKANQYDTEKLLAHLVRLGWEPVDDPARADLVVVNTCAVTARAEKKSRQALARARRIAPGARVAALGCLVARLRNQGTPFPPAWDLASPGGAREEGRREFLKALGAESIPPAPPLEGFRRRTRAFLKVQDGCSFRCTYCVIPSLRGPSRSRPSAEVLQEAAALVRGGTREIVLTGVCLGDWKEEGRGLAFLLERLLEMEGSFRIRLSSLEPERAEPSLLEVLAGAPAGRICPHLHLPLQSGSDRILKRMGRRYQAGDFRRFLLEARRALGEDLAFTTDVIVGFPGEREADLQATLDLLEELQPTRVHVFPYSPREGTPATRFPDPLPPEVRKERTARLLEAARRLAREAARRRVGTREEVLLEDEREGTTARYQRVRLLQGRGRPGEILPVEITACREEVLLARPADQEEEPW